ncbi:hypothetical protein [Streptomyces sp. CB01373]|uniref:hypothetical protein n=1 Tax=Streptomyces sp. CB01373 TaxID=2020325 RepID=UPI00131BAD2C|nr:hypothetical protein [Streptomyces sp. CB01373]
MGDQLSDGAHDPGGARHVAFAHDDGAGADEGADTDRPPASHHGRVGAGRPTPGPARLRGLAHGVGELFCVRRGYAYTAPGAAERSGIRP